MSGTFKKGDPRTVELARKGGRVKAEKDRKRRSPYDGSVVDVATAAGFVGGSWTPQRAALKAMHGLPMSDEELAVYRRHTEREERPTESVSEAVLCCGRRSGKGRMGSVVGWYRAISFDPTTLAPGETACVQVMARDRDQARVVFSYIKALAELDEFEPYVHRVLRDRIELHNNLDIWVVTASYGSTRGYTIICAILDELAFWMVDGSNPDHEVVRAIRPGMATVDGSLLLILSSPYATRGVLYEMHDRYFGRDDGHVVVWNADTASMNSQLPEHVIERAFEADAVVAASEYGQNGRVVFRKDVENFLDPEAIYAVTAEDVREIPPSKGEKYVAFVDPSGGSSDSFSLGVAHLEDGVAVLDAVRERKPPFSPDDVVQEFAELLNTYRVREVVGDRYGGEWPRERFRVHGIEYEPSERTKTEIYREFVAPVNGERVRLLDLPVLRAQLLSLERRVSRGGRDSIDHGPGAHDDVANAAAGALGLLAGPRRGRMRPRVYFPGMDSLGHDQGLREAMEQETERKQKVAEKRAQQGS